MEDERWNRSKDLYAATLRIEPGQRRAFLAHACGTDQSLRRELNTLLDYESRARNFLELPAVDLRAEFRSGPADAPDIVGTSLGHYQVLEKAGTGGMGVVYRAYDRQLERDVAIKLLAGEPETTSRMRLLDEARAAARLAHPGICAVYGVTSANGHACIVMEFVPGEPLADLLKNGPLGTDEVIRFGGQLAEALAHAHERGVIHGDIKSANILVTPERRIKILDFGLARRMRPATSPTPGPAFPMGALAGTVAYMAPELLLGREPDVHSDIWSLGVVLYEMAAGFRPFSGPGTLEVCSTILNSPHQPLPGRVPEPLRSVIERCLAKEPERRFQHALELGSELQTVPWRAAVTQALSRKIAVLPFENLPVSGATGHLAQGIHDAVITDLYRLSGLRVIARHSSMALGKEHLSRVPARLNGVDGVMTGTISIAGDTIELSIQLADATSGEIVWADRYNSLLADTARVRKDIVARVCEAMRLQCDAQQAQAGITRVKPETSALYMKARFFLNKLTPDGLAKGLAYLRTAVEADPGEPLVHAGLALAYVLVAHQASVTLVSDPFVLAKPYAAKAIHLNPQLPEAHQALAEIKTYLDWDFAAAEHEYRTALALSNDNLAEAHAHYSWYLMLAGRESEQMAHMKMAQELDPLNPVYHVWMGQHYAIAGRWTDATPEAQAALEINPGTPDALVLLGHAYLQRGMIAEGIECQEQAAAIDPRLSTYALAATYARIGRSDDARRIAAELRKNPDHWNAYGLASIYAALNDADEALFWLEQMYASRHMYTPWVRIAPEWASLRDDARFQKLAHRLPVPIGVTWPDR